MTCLLLDRGTWLAEALQMIVTSSFVSDQELLPLVSFLGSHLETLPGTGFPLPLRSFSGSVGPSAVTYGELTVPKLLIE